MKTSIRWSGLLLGLILAVSVWAQEQEEDQQQSGESAEETAAAEPEAPDAQEQAAETDASDESAASGEAEQAGAADTQAAEPSEAANALPATDEVAGESAETFVFQGHPIFSPETAELVYRPLVNYLNDALPYRFDLELAPDFHRYWLSTRRGQNPHLVLEEPHLTAYRMEEHGYTPLVRAQAPITYSLLTSMNNAESSVQDFIGRRVSTMPAPSLGYLILTSWFDNPMQQPVIQSNAASWLDAVEIVFSQEADAAIVPYNLVSRYVNMANVLTSQEFPGVTIAASPEVPVDIQEEIRAALLALHEDEEHFAALNELDISQFIEARPGQYEGLEEWLELVYSTL
jgi:ABC-type phosphate/phosphonate transport system substrate-binding protein